MYFTAEGTRYAVNGTARTNGDASEIDGIWAADPTGVAPKKDILGPTTALLALAASVAISGGRAYLLMALPFVLSVIITYLQYLYSDLMAMGGYKRALEEEIERRTGFPIIQWESRVVPSRFSRAQVFGTN